MGTGSTTRMNDSDSAIKSSGPNLLCEGVSCDRLDNDDYDKPGTEEPTLVTASLHSRFCNTWTHWNPDFPLWCILQHAPNTQITSLSLSFSLRFTTQ